MVKRRHYMHYLYLAFALIVMMVTWESNKTNAAAIEPAIPEQSIRLRILANSDEIGDQAVKRRIRDAIVEQMNGWVKGPQSIVEARRTVVEHLPELERLVAAILEHDGVTYGAKMDLGVVPFPTKLYGDRVYPAGDYEALRVTLGEGTGQNWWCVLFPPLCFVDAVTGEAAAPAEPEDRTAQTRSAQANGKAESNGQSANEPGKKKPDRANAKTNKSGADNGDIEAAGKEHAQADGQPTLQVAEKKQVHFFLWDMLKKLFAWVSGLFGRLFG